MKRPKGPSRTASARQVRIPTSKTEFSTWWDRWYGLGLFVPQREDGSPGEDVSARQLSKERKMKRPNGVSAAGLPSLAEWKASTSLARFPNVDSLMNNHNWDDLAPKGKRCLMLFVDDTSIRMLIKLETDCLKTSCVARGYDEVFAVMEKLLATGQVIWEQDAPRPSPGRKKGK